MTLYASSLAAGLADPAWKAEYLRLFAQLAQANVAAGGAYTIDPRNRGALDLVIQKEIDANNLKYFPLSGGRPPRSPTFDAGVPFTTDAVNAMLANSGFPPTWAGLDAWVQFGGGQSLAQQGLMPSMLGMAVDGNGYFVAPDPGLSPAVELGREFPPPDMSTTVADKIFGAADVAGLAYVFSVAGASIIGGAAPASSAPTVAATETTTTTAAVSSPSVTASSWFDSAASKAGSLATEAVKGAGSLVVKAGESVVVGKAVQALSPKPPAPPAPPKRVAAPVSAAPANGGGFLARLVTDVESLLGGLLHALGA